MLNYRLIKIFTEKQCDEIIEKLQDENLWVDGKLTAGAAIKHKKSNKEILTGCEIYNQILHQLNIAFADNQEVNSQLLRKRVISGIINRFKHNDKYDGHFDSEFMPSAYNSEPVRTDYSFTVFLNNNFDGGCLRIEDTKIKPKKGYGCFYTSDRWHSVTTVKNGTRYAIVGWIESLIQDHEIRRCCVSLSNILNHTWLDKNKPMRKEDLQELEKIKQILFHRYL